MGHRLSKIYTRTGDKGDTGLGNGGRTDKDDPRIEAIGAVDEVNSLIGLLATETLPDQIRLMLTNIQHDLFDLGGELSIPGQATLTEIQVNRLESDLDSLNEQLNPLQEFILPGGSRAAALCHVARSVCRRAERRTVTLSKEESVSPVTLQYLNRLSDLLFVLARQLNKSGGIEDVLWKPGKNRN
ncbi:MAG: cob(I)yrinic acid a,c-diamide adenosyltransferase [Gammaproteobacteria bacterium]|nr:cob(I)yrinic acid a,c-diamide adenosyltransferase [Gammaproteobacteria bacterium]